MSLYFYFLFFFTYYIIQIECSQTCECSNNNFKCQTEYGCWYCSYCFSNNKTCSIHGDIKCSEYQSETQIWPWFIIFFPFILISCISILILLKYFSCSCKVFCCSCIDFCFCECCHLCSLNKIQIDQILQQNNNNNHNNLPTISSDLQVNQIDQSLQQNNNNSPTCSICLENLHNNNKQIRTISCGHTFHQNCIDSWFNERPINPSCPFRCQLF